MRYEVRLKNPNGRESRFELERDEELKAGDTIGQGTMIYKVVRILPDSDESDAVVEAEWLAGPAQFERSL
jgi:hypothetical protein